MYKTALCSMMHHPIDLQFWIDHHLYIVKFDYIFLRLENSDHVKINNDRVIIVEREIIKNSNDSILYQQYRQQDFVNRCLHHYVNAYSIKFLLHIDNDELLVLNFKYDSIHSLINCYLNYPYTNLRIQNFEAVLLDKSSSSNLFLQTLYFKDCSMEKCRSYSNGKSITLISESIECTGCHTFSGLYFAVPKSEVIILHYDSLIYSKWFDKFKHLSKITSKIYDQIPFPFYKSSIDKIKNNETNLQQFWLSEVSHCDNPIYIPFFYHFPHV